MNDMDTMLYEGMEQAMADLKEMEPGTPEYKTQAEVVRIYNDMIREREKYIDEVEEKSRKKTFKDWFKEINWLDVIVKYGLPAGVSFLELVTILIFEGNGGFIKTKGFSIFQKQNKPV